MKLVDLMGERHAGGESFNAHELVTLLNSRTLLNQLWYFRRLSWRMITRRLITTIIVSINCSINQLFHRYFNEIIFQTIFSDSSLNSPWTQSVGWSWARKNPLSSTIQDWQYWKLWAFIAFYIFWHINLINKYTYDPLSDLPSKSVQTIDQFRTRRPSRRKSRSEIVQQGECTRLGNQKNTFNLVQHDNQ